MDDQAREFLGVGWAFPVTLTVESGQVELARFDDDIQQSILIILSTAKGERVMRPDFGCGIHDLVFDPNDATTAASIRVEVNSALVTWEPRIEVLDVTVTTDSNDEARLLIVDAD